MLVVGLGIEVYAEFKGGNFPPRPARFVGICLLYGILAMLAGFNGSFAVALGAGLLIALIVKMPKIVANSKASGSSLSKSAASDTNPGTVSA